MLKHHRRHLAPVAIVALVGLLASTPLVAATNVQDLGGLTADGYGAALAVNPSGSKIIGLARDPVSFQTVQALWTAPGQVTQLSACCASGLGMPKSINLGGEAVGDYTATRDHWAPVYWSAQGVPQALPTLGSFGLGRAFAINGQGQAVGSSVEDDFSQSAVLWDRTSSVTRLGTMGEPGSGYTAFHEAHGINASGVVVGTALIQGQYRAFLWQGGQFTDLGLGNATHISDIGLVAGYTSGMIPVTWTGTTMSYLKGRDGRSRAYGHLVHGINAKGHMVGYGPAPNPGVHNIAVLWKGRKVITLGHFPGGTHSEATGITDRGVIVGFGNLVDGGPMHALQWTVTKTGVQVEKRP